MTQKGCLLFCLKQHQVWSLHVFIFRTEQRPSALREKVHFGHWWSAQWSIRCESDLHPLYELLLIQSSWQVSLVSQNQNLERHRWNKRELSMSQESAAVNSRFNRSQPAVDEATTGWVYLWGRWHWSFLKGALLSFFLLLLRPLGSSFTSPWWAAPRTLGTVSRVCVSLCVCVTGAQWESPARLGSALTGIPCSCGLSSRLWSSFLEASIFSGSAASTMYLQQEKQQESINSELNSWSTKSTRESKNLQFLWCPLEGGSQSEAVTIHPTTKNSFDPCFSFIKV